MLDVSHWLPFPQPITYQVSTLVCIEGLSPHNSSILGVPRRGSLRSSLKAETLVPRVTLCTMTLRLVPRDHSAMFH